MSAPRVKEETILTSLMGAPGSFVPPIWIWGPAGSGKRAVINSALQSAPTARPGLFHARLAVVGAGTSRGVFEKLFNSLHGYIPDASSGFAPHSRLDSAPDFVGALQKVLPNTPTTPTTYFVLEGAEHLPGLGLGLLPLFTRLREHTGRNVGVIFVAETRWSHTLDTTGGVMMAPASVYFAPYSRSELTELFRAEGPPCPSGMSWLERPESLDMKKELWAAFVTVFVQVFAPAVRDSTELRRLAVRLWPEYAAGAVDEAAVGRRQELLNASRAKFNDALDSLYSVGASDEAVLLDALELPLYGRFVIVAGYLASYNAASMDLTTFTAVSGKRKRSRSSGKAKMKDGVAVDAVAGMVGEDEAGASRMVGPKPFPLERLYAIYSALVDASGGGAGVSGGAGSGGALGWGGRGGHASLATTMLDESIAQGVGAPAGSVDIGKAVGSAVSLGLFARLGGGTSLVDGARLVALVDHDTAVRLSKSIGIDLGRYLAI